MTAKINALRLAKAVLVDSMIDQKKTDAKSLQKLGETEIKIAREVRSETRAVQNHIS